MKKALLLTAAAAAVFTGGYWTGSSHTASPVSGSRPGPVAAAAARASETAVKVGPAASGTEVRTFTAGRPFAKGGAKAWLLAMAAELGGERRDLEFAIVDMAQVFMTMDEASALETCEALTEIMALLEAGDPALKAINDGDDLGEGAYLLTVFRLSQLNPAAALEALKKLPKGVPDEATKLVFGRLAGQNPARAEELVATLPADQQGDALEGIFNSMATKDPAVALAFAEKYPAHLNGYDRDRVLRDLMRKNPQQGIAAAVSITGKTKEPHSLQSAFGDWLERDATAAKAWASQHQGPGRAAVQATLVEQQVNDDPQAAMTAFAALDASPAEKKDLGRAAVAIARNLANQDPASVPAWLNTLQDGTAKDGAATQLAEIWTHKNPEAASEWIKTLPAGDVRDESARSLIRRITDRDPAAAYEWARSISNEASRKETMAQVFQVWKEADPESAQAAASEPSAKP